MIDMDGGRKEEGEERERGENYLHRWICLIVGPGCLRHPPNNKIKLSILGKLEIK